MRVPCSLLALAMITSSCTHGNWPPLRRPGQETKAAVEYYVSPTGDDSNPGGRALPFQTLERARRAIREMREANALPEGGVCVFLRQGDYVLPDGFVLGEQDSGSEQAPVTWRGWPGEQARFLGGQFLPPAAFQPVADEAVAARLAPEARSQVRVVDLTALGIGNLQELPVQFRGACRAMELFFDNIPMQLARWPNEEWVTIAAVIDRGSREEKRPGTFVYSEDRQSTWNVERGVWLQGYWCHDWSDETIRVGKIDPATKQITLAAQHSYGVGASHSWNKVPRRYYALNLLEELDAPGEWYLDVTAAKLYFWPPAAFGPDSEILLSTTTEPVVNLDKTRFVRIQGLTIEGGRADGVRVSGSDNLVAACTIRNLGGRGVGVSGHRNEVVGCDIHNTGTSGITLDGGNRNTLEPGRNNAENNHIHDFARLQRTYAAAVHLSGVGNRAAHNLIHDCPHSGILYGGNNQIIEFNELFSTCLETGDVGALYTGRDWGSLGNEIRHNFIHNVGGVRGWSMGVYLDDCDNGDTIHGNVFYKVHRAAFIGGGRYNRVTNNVFVDCTPAVHLDSRGTSRIQWNAGLKESWDLQAKLEQFNYTQPPWSEAYPFITNIMEDEPALPKYNVVRNNVCVAGTWLNARGVNLDHQDFGDNWIGTEDPGFADPRKLDFQLRRNSPIWQEVPGFERIPTDKMGLYKDELRATWPVRVERPDGWDAKAHERAKTEDAARQLAALPVHTAAKTESGIEVDGLIRAEEWRDAGEPMVLAKNPGGDKAAPASDAWVMAGKDALYIAFDNPLGGPLHAESIWGRNDAVEIAFKTQAGYVVLRGYANGHWESSPEGGLAEDAAKQAAQGVRYAARTAENDRWSAEWEIPWHTTGIAKPTPGTQIPLNLTVRKVSAGQWIMWQGTGGWSFQADKAGLLRLP